MNKLSKIKKIFKKKEAKVNLQESGGVQEEFKSVLKLEECAADPNAFKYQIVWFDQNFDEHHENWRTLDHLRKSGFTIDNVRSIEEGTTYMYDLKENQSKRQNLKEVIVISSGRLKEKVVDLIKNWNKQENESAETPLQILKMMVYCGYLQGSIGMMTQYPDLVYTVIIGVNKIAPSLNEII